MKLQDFFYELPPELIAQYPLDKRDQSRLLVLDRKSGEVRHRHFSEIAEFFEPGDVLVLNNTRVFKARLKGKKETGGNVEMLLVREIEKGNWEVLVHSSKRLKIGTKIFFDDKSFAIVVNKMPGRCVVEFNAPAMEMIKKYGIVPLPHYIRRHTVPQDEQTYQTVYADPQGSIAAPTAGLHFTKEILKEIEKKGTKICQLTLHIGPGTFKPIRTQDIERHVMDAEYAEISQETADAINAARRVIGVGTSVTRTLESILSNPPDILLSKRGNVGQGHDPAQRGFSLADKKGNQIECKPEGLPYANRGFGDNCRDKAVAAFSGFTDLFIFPGHRFQVIDHLITNFHLPCSTPLLLVCAFAGKELIFKAYKEAVKNKYRFLSYGDSMLII
ncbi:MAG TPA: tRNA preQ1(34) S-adenosylmethionine ribosyltransferase-isomerase QueA [bacterium]